MYHLVLIDAASQGAVTISSEKLADISGVNAAQVRKDLSHLGTYGTRGVGYDVKHLLGEISRELGLTQNWPVALVGFGNLGHALANYQGFDERGFRIAAIFDVEKKKVGERVGDLTVGHLDDLEKVLEREGITMAILAVPGWTAQDVADRLIVSGVRSILNFAPVVLNVPDEVWVRKVDLSMELQILSFYSQRK